MVGPLDCPPEQALCGLLKLAGPTREDHHEGDARRAPGHGKREGGRWGVGLACWQCVAGSGR